MKFFRFRRNNNNNNNVIDETTASHTQSRVIGQGRLRLPAKKKTKKRSSMGGSTTDPSTSSNHDRCDDSSSSDFDDRSHVPHQDDDDDEEDVLTAYHIDDLVLGELLGQGTFAAVHAILCIAPAAAAAARSNNSGSGSGSMFQTDLALKRLHQAKTFTNYQAVIADLATEAWILHSLPHPNMVGLHAVVDDGTPCKALVLDRLHSTLRDERRRWYKWAPAGQWHLMRALRPQTYNHVERLRMQVAVELASALAHLHAHGICHRDIKPSNVGFDSKGTVKLFDFGFARSLPETPHKKGGGGDNNTNNNNDDDAVYRLTARMGTWRYMAPEVAKGQPYNLKCDVYSFALVLWEMLVGQKPHGQLANASEELKQLVGTPPPCDNVDTKWQVILHDAWCEKISQRNTMAVVKAALVQLQQEFQQAKNHPTSR